MGFTYNFPVVKGIQAYKEYYIAMVPLKMLSRLFSDDVEYVEPEYRAQRKINEKRIPVIAKYILENRDNYVFSALAASIDGDFHFIPDHVGSSLGILEIDMDAVFLINDGQHRKTAIIGALKEDPELGEETIPIVLFEDHGLRRSQQIFTDLNKNAVRTSNSISELYDSRDEVAVVTRKVISEIEFLNTYTDKEKDILGKFSSNLFTLNVFYNANKSIIGTNSPLELQEFLLQFWTCVCNHMQQWQELTHHQISKKELREDYLSTQNIVIQAFGKIGAFLYHNPVDNMEMYLSKLNEINWSRRSNVWKYRAINSKGRIITNKTAVHAIYCLIKEKIGLELSEDEKALNQEYNERIRMDYERNR